MYKIVAMQTLAPQTKLASVHAPEIAKKAQVGQFVILRVDEKGERIPLTLADWDPENGTITLIFQEVGVSTKKFGSLDVNDELKDVVGPLGQPSDIKDYGTVVIVGGGVGIAPCLPIVKAFRKTGNKVISIIGARNEKLLILEKEMRHICDEVYITTDDGSKGYKGFGCDMLKILIEKGYSIDIVYAIGPTVMMRAVAEVTRPYKIKTIVSLNPIMLDGMGMCGACRVSVGGKIKFACFDGPEFDGHLVDFNELIKRQRAFLAEEKLALDHWQKCRGN
ncbi:sulfide/dihydroorotate dehydrogenase-like FAD/NAD-binding protein [Candidatus Bathyarchaeota archaeon]|nr:sulfide/dihydroorotate dehydrogenase-like FAD/NAD-binding protein [Candidatus Bathyarchaeota archaeon]